MKKFLLAMLAVLMFSTIGTANILAEEDKPFDSYISFGDSYTRGMGIYQDNMFDENEDEASNKDIRIVDGAYTTQIAEYYNIIPAKGDSQNKEEQYDGQKMFGKKIDETKYYPTATYGLKMTGALHLLKGDKYLENENWSEGGLIKGYIPQLFSLYGYDKDGKIGSEGHIRTKIENGGNALITVNLGLADVIFSGSTDAVDWKTISSLLNDTEVMKDFLVDFAKSTLERYKTWANEYEQFIKELKSLNKKATIVLIGFMNPLREVCISDDLMLPLGSISDPVIALMNETLRFYAKKYNCIYVDITNGESMAVQKEWNLTSTKSAEEESTSDSVINNFFAAIHPTPDTMDYIARQVIDCIDNKYSWFKPSNEINVDLIRYDSKDVKLVVLDGEVISNPTIENNTLKIEAADKKAKTLQVFVRDEDTKAIGVRTYIIMYRNGKYESYCLDSTSDLEAKTSKVLNPILKYMEGNEKLKPIKEAIEKYLEYLKVINSVSEKVEKLEEMGVNIKKILTFLDKIKDITGSDKFLKQTN